MLDGPLEKLNPLWAKQTCQKCLLIWNAVLGPWGGSFLCRDGPVQEPWHEEQATPLISMGHGLSEPFSAFYLTEK